jgi:chromosomal replication initiation ATPase DnaA
MINAQQLIFDLGHRTALGREDFLISPANEDAVAWIDSWPDWSAPALVIYGPAACGKTHLAAVWSERTGAYFVTQDDLNGKDADAIAALSEHLVIDHLDPWIGDKVTETKLFHLYNILKEEKRTMLVTMRMAPRRADFQLADLASRVRAAPAVSVQPPDDALLAAVMVKLFNDRQIQIGHDVLDYILPRMERSFAAARDLASAADRMALTEKKPVSVALIRKILLETGL